MSAASSTQEADKMGAGAYPAVTLEAGVEAHAHIAHIHAQAKQFCLVVTIDSRAFLLERLHTNPPHAGS